jgi:hypothetical protein
MSPQVVKVAVRNKHAEELFKHKRGKVAYHGADTRKLHKFELAKEEPRLRLRPSVNTFHGEGCYLTPSFQMALRYAHSHWEGPPRFATPPELDGLRYAWQSAKESASMADCACACLAGTALSSWR